MAPVAEAKFKGKDLPDPAVVGPGVSVELVIDMELEVPVAASLPAADAVLPPVALAEPEQTAVVGTVTLTLARALAKDYSIEGDSH